MVKQKAFMQAKKGRWLQLEPQKRFHLIDKDGKPVTSLTPGQLLLLLDTGPVDRA